MHKLITTCKLITIKHSDSHQRVCLINKCGDRCLEHHKLYYYTPYACQLLLVGGGGGRLMGQQWTCPNVSKGLHMSKVFSRELSCVICLSCSQFLHHCQTHTRIQFLKLFTKFSRLEVISAYIQYYDILDSE